MNIPLDVAMTELDLIPEGSLPQNIIRDTYFCLRENSLGRSRLERRRIPRSTPASRVIRVTATAAPDSRRSLVDCREMALWAAAARVRTR